MNDWQSDVREFHRALGLRSSPEINGAGELAGEDLHLRIRLIREELSETVLAFRDLDLVEFCDGLVDLAYVILGAGDAAGAVIRTRYRTLLDTTRLRGWGGWTRGLKAEIGLVQSCLDNALSHMHQHADQGTAFKRFDLLGDCMVMVAHCMSATGLDFRPLWSEVHRSNLAKRGGPIVDGKQKKPEGWTPPDIRGELIRQGVSA
jgi:predicted HAD superfamily Cof-like phosphohydrolase